MRIVRTCAVATSALFLVLSVRATCLSAGGKIGMNQVGYQTLSPKYVFFPAAVDSFRVVSGTSGGTVFSDHAILWKSADGATGQNVYRGDFSSLTVPGVYRIISSAGDTSGLFSISDTVFGMVFRKSLKGFYFQRCGMALTTMYAGAYQHAACHQGDGTFHSSTDTTGSLPSVGGWHDAGDYGKYVVNAGVTTGTLLLAYEMFPASFADDDLGIPESGNGVPDILDEVRYELEWFLKMQRWNGGFHFKETREQFELFVMPQSDTGTRYVYTLSTAATGDATAALARAARLFALLDPTFSQTCLAAARQGWQYLSAHPTIVPVGGFKNPSGTATGEYGDTGDSDERLWAAAELFETTGEEAFHTYFQSAYGSGSLFGGAMGWADVRPLALLTYLQSQQPGASGSIKTTLRQALTSYCSSLASRRNSSGYHVVLQTWEYWWGSNSNALNAAVLLLAGFSETADTLYRDIAADQLHYILGANGLARSFVTGVGQKPPRNPHHRPSASDGVTDPVPGLLAGGPNEYGGDPALDTLIARFSPPPALCYIDTMPSYASNEIAINWNAPLVFVAGYFRGKEGVTGVRDDIGQLPEGMSLDQNYPNPFNGTTRITFAVDRTANVELAIYDVLGRKVEAVLNETKMPGRYAVSWDGGRVASGVYFLRLQALGRKITKRLMLLR